MEGSRAVKTEIVELEAVNGKFTRWFLGLCSQNDENRISGAYLFNDGRIFLPQVLVCSLNQRLASRLPGRHVNLQAIQLHECDSRLGSQQINQGSRHRDCTGLNQRGNVSAPLMPQYKLADRHMDAGIQRNVEIGKLNFACKMRLQNLLGSIEHHCVDSGP